MSRLQSLLSTLEEGRAVDKLNSRNDDGVRDAVIAETQARYDHLAGVPNSRLSSSAQTDE